MPEWLTVTEASTLLGIPKSKIYDDCKKDLEFDVNDRGIRILSRAKLEEYYAPIQRIVRQSTAIKGAIQQAHAALILQQEDHIKSLKDQIDTLKEELQHCQNELRIAHEEKNKILELFQTLNN